MLLLLMLLLLWLYVRYICLMLKLKSGGTRVTKNCQFVVINPHLNMFFGNKLAIHIE